MPGLSEYKIPSYLEQLAGAKGIQELTLGRLKELRDTGKAFLESQAAWQEIPTTYLVCARDRGTPARRQRDFARKADTVVEIDAGHHPFLSRPEEVRDLVLHL